MRLLTLTFVRASKMGSLRTMVAVVLVYRREWERESVGDMGGLEMARGKRHLPHSVHFQRGFILVTAFSSVNAVLSG